MKFLCLVLAIPAIAWSNHYASEIHPYVDCEISFEGLKRFLDAKIYYLDGDMKYFQASPISCEFKNKLDVYKDLKQLVDQIDLSNNNKELNIFIEDRKFRSWGEMFKNRNEFDFYQGMIAAYEDVQSHFVKTCE